jgi:hypothetical protein
MLIWLVVASALWALDIEITYEHNLRQGIPADYLLHRQRIVYTWRT